MTTARNATEALAEANRLQRARQIITEGYSFTVEPSGSIAVCKPGRLAASYWIDEDGCDCADRLKTKKPCKHEHAWKLLRAEQADEEKMWEAQCAKWEAENEELPAYDRTRLLMLSELRRAEQGLKASEGTAATAGWNQRVQECDAALKMYDEVQTKQAIDFYKRVPADPMNFPAH